MSWDTPIASDPATKWRRKLSLSKKLKTFILISDCYTFRSAEQVVDGFFSYLALAWLQPHVGWIKNEGCCSAILLKTVADVRVQWRSVTDHYPLHVLWILAFFVPISSLSCEKSERLMKSFLVALKKLTVRSPKV